jgi:hypothetical protein
VNEIRILAARGSLSLNHFMSALIDERVGEMKALAHIRVRATRADFGSALEILE